MRREYPPLWRRGGVNQQDAGEPATLESLFDEFSSKPEPKPWSILCKNSLVVGQEFALACYFLARHRMAQYEEAGLAREDPTQQAWSLIALPLSLLLVALFSNARRSRQKTRTRLLDALLLAALLRLLAAVLKTLTASYSSDTVHALAITGMIIHLLGCDYAYANGFTTGTRQHQEEPQEQSVSTATTSLLSSQQPQEPFLGGTMSLNAAFFSTTLLASRLSSNWTVHLFVSSSVTIFAFYPATRHGLFLKSPIKAPYVILFTILMLAAATYVLLESMQEKIIFVGVLVTICWVAPAWKYHLQCYKVNIHGPWDIAHISIEQKQE
mmetsp:Transcript_31950/g.52743  ORF Transcript_31950/g.52743 Transcript_31950/m.52743 type:complete len:325 (+) Transcript_31950:188-1162(+)